MANRGVVVPARICQPTAKVRPQSSATTLPRAFVQKRQPETLSCLAFVFTFSFSFSVQFKFIFGFPKTCKVQPSVEPPTDLLMARDAKQSSATMLTETLSGLAFVFTFIIFCVQFKMQDCYWQKQLMRLMRATSRRRVHSHLASVSSWPQGPKLTHA